MINLMNFVYTAMIHTPSLQMIKCLQRNLPTYLMPTAYSSEVLTALRFLTPSCSSAADP